jgi:hypothetical protein
MKRNHVRQIIGCRIDAPTLPVDDIRRVVFQVACVQAIPKVGITVY